LIEKTAIRRREDTDAGDVRAADASLGPGDAELARIFLLVSTRRTHSVDHLELARFQLPTACRHRPRSFDVNVDQRECDLIVSRISS